MNINYYRVAVTEYQLRGRGGGGSAVRLHDRLVLSYSQTSSGQKKRSRAALTEPQQLQSCGWKQHQTVKTSFTQSLVNYWNNLSGTRSAFFFFFLLLTLQLSAQTFSSFAQLKKFCTRCEQLEDGGRRAVACYIHHVFQLLPRSLSRPPLVLHTCAPPPAPHPLVTLVCICVRSLSSHLLCRPDPVLNKTPSGDLPAFGSILSAPAG